MESFITTTAAVLNQNTHRVVVYLHGIIAEINIVHFVAVNQAVHAIAAATQNNFIFMF